MEEVQRLCDVHAAVFKGSIEDIHREDRGPETPGHPVHTFKLENQALKDLIDHKLAPAVTALRESDSQENILKAIAAVNELADIDKHYSRKENLLFPYLEKYGIYAPQSHVGVDDEIREEITKLKDMLTDYQGNPESVLSQFKVVADRVKDMIFKEEKILLPMALENLAEDEWIQIRDASPEIGFAWWNQARSGTRPARNWSKAEPMINQFIFPLEFSSRRKSI